MRPVKGLNKDAEQRNQPEGTYREALNATLDEELGVLRREKGFEQANQFTDESIQGHIILDESVDGSQETGNVVLFLYNSTNGESRIVEWNIPNQTTTVHLDDGKSSGETNDEGKVVGIDGTLDFSSPIQAVYRRLETGDTVLYWTDGVQEPRFLNLNQSAPSDVENLSIFGKINSRIEFDLSAVRNFGGNLQGGTYQLAFAYVDDDGSTTNYFHITNPIRISSRENFGVDSESRTSKSIEFELSNLDTDYPFIRVAAIKGTTVSILPDISISDTSLTYTFTGNENSRVGSLQDVVVDEASYKTADVIQDHEGTLYMANLTRTERVDFQKHANDVTLKAISKPVTDLIDTNRPLEAFKESEFAAMGTYKRGEVYAFYISYLLRDGSETPAFHIPGPGNTSGAGASGDDPFEADIVVNTDLPSPSPAQAIGDFGTVKINDEAVEARHAAIQIDTEAIANGGVSVDYIDDNGVTLSTINVAVSNGDSPNDIANAIASGLNKDSTFSSDFSASVVSGDVVEIVADSTGTQWNGYDVKITFTGEFQYTNLIGTTGGGQDTQATPTHEITVDWDTGSTTVTVDTLTVPMTADNVASEYVTKLNNDSTFSADFTASSSGSTVTITADQDGADYNAEVTVDDTTNGLELHNIFLEGGYASGDDLPLDVKVYKGASYTSISGLTSGMAKNDAASQIQSELDTNGPSGFDYTVTDNVVTIKDTNDRSIGGQTPDLRSPFTLGVTSSSYSPGGSDAKKANAKIIIEGSSPNIAASTAVGTADATDTPTDSGTKATGELLEVTSSSNADATFDAKIVDDNGNVQYNTTITIADGDTQGTVADRIVQQLIFNTNVSNDVVLSANQNTTGAITGEGASEGSQYNGWDLVLDNFSVSSPFFYSASVSLSGGDDPGGTYGDIKVRIEWDNGNSSIEELVTVDHDKTQAEVAAAIVTALNNNTTFSNNYSATDNNDGTFTVESNAQDSTYNGSIEVTDTVASNLVDFESISGGNTGSEDIEVNVVPYPGSDTTTLKVPQSYSKEDIAFDIYEALVDNSSYAGRLTFELNTNEVVIIDENQTSALNGESPSIYGAYTIPNSIDDFSGGGSSGGGGGGNVSVQKSEITSGHPLDPYNSNFSIPLKSFHVDASKFQDGFSYWEQAPQVEGGESYEDEDRWDIVDKDGNVIGTVRDRPVRHHRFPEIKEEPFIDENPSSGSEDLYVFGIKAEDIHVPEDVRDKVVGYKIYYAKKNPKDRLVLDQSLGIYGWLDHPIRERLGQQRDEIFSDKVWSPHALGAFTDFDGDGEGLKWDVDHNLLQLHPFETMRKRIQVQGVTHVKVVATTGANPPIYDPDTPEGKYDEFLPDDQIRKVNAISYIDQNARDVSLSSFGFSRNYDNLLGESKIIVETEQPENPGLGYNQIPLCDICQLQVNVHKPYDNQELVSTGFVGDIDEDKDDASAPDPPVIYGGDVHIEPWFFKAHTLLALASEEEADLDSEQNEWWNQEAKEGRRNLYEKKNDGEEWLTDLKDSLFQNNINSDEQKGLIRAMKELIGDTSGINGLPICWGTLWSEIVESRDHPWFRTTGEGNLETFYPSSTSFIANPDLGDIPQDVLEDFDSEDIYRKAKWIFRFFKESDNWFGYNEEYSKQNIVDAAFPFRANDTIPTKFPTRVIRSATVGESGERSAWRTFLEEDFVDLPQDRGEVVNIAPIGSDILIHTTEALFRTRADQRIKTTSDSAFVGSGDLFRPTPREVISLDEGYGGLLDHRASQVYERGYVFVDQEAGKVIQFTDQPQEISDQGMRKFFRDNLTTSSQPRVGYDPYTGRIFVSDKGEGWVYSFHPGLKAWVSRHSVQSYYYFTTRDHLYSVIGDTIYRVSTGTPGEYDGNTYPFEIEYIQSSPRPDGELIVSLLIDSRVFNGSGAIPQDTFDQFRVINSHQDTGLINIRPKVREDGTTLSNPNARLTDQAWKINEIRDGVDPKIINTEKWRRRRRLSDNYHRVKLIYDTDGRAIELFSSALITRTSRR